MEFVLNCIYTIYRIATWTSAVRFYGPKKGEQKLSRFRFGRAVRVRVSLRAHCVFFAFEAFGSFIGNS